MRIVSANITGSLILNGVDVTDFLTSSSENSGSIAQKLSSLESSTGSLNSFTSSINTTIKNKLNSETVISGSVQVNITGTTGYSDFSSSISNSVGSLSGSVATTTSGLSSTIGSLSSSVATTTSNLSSSVGSLSSSVATTTSNLSSSIGILSGSVATTTSNLSSSIGSLSSSVATTTSNLSSSIGSLSSSVASTTSNLSSRIQSVETKTGSYATTGSNIFIGSQVITGSLYITTDLVVQGSSSLQNITASAVSIGTNTVILNTDTPAVRFAGVSVQDSGSNAGVTGSIFWDGLCNRWVYSNPSGVGYSGGLLISGPRNTGTLGEEAGTTSCALMMGQGGDHITSSAIFSYGNATCFYGTSFISGSGNACFSGQVCSNTVSTTDGTNTSTLANNYLRYNGGDFYVDACAVGGNFRIRTSNTSALDNTALFICGGNSQIGVGTVNPLTTFTVKSTNDNGYALTRPSNDSVYHWRLSTTETGTDAYTVRYNTFNNDIIFSNYLAGGTGGHMYFRTSASGGPGSESNRLTITPSGAATFACSLTANQICSPSFIGGAISGTCAIFSTLTASNGAGTSINITTNSNNGTSASPLQTNLNFRGFNNNLNGQIRVDDISGTAQIGSMQFYTWNSSQVLSLTLGHTGIACFASTVCAPRLQVLNTNSVVVIEGTATNGEGTLTVAGKNSSGTSRSAVLKYDNTDVIRVATADAIPMRFETSDVARMSISSTGISCFACRICAPNLTISGTASIYNSTSIDGAIDPGQHEVISTGFNIVGQSSLDISNIGITTNKWKAIVKGGFANNNEGGGLTSPALEIEVDSNNPTIDVGTTDITFSRNSSTGRLQVTNNGANNLRVTFVGTIHLINYPQSVLPSRSKIMLGNVGIGVTEPIDRLMICGVDSGLYISNSTRSKINLHTCGCGGWQIETANGSGNQPAGALGITEVGVGSRFHIAKGGITCFSNTLCAPTIVPTSVLAISGNSSAYMCFYRDYSGSPSHPGFAIANTSGTVTLAHNANGGTTSMRGNLRLNGVGNQLTFDTTDGSNSTELGTVNDYVFRIRNTRGVGTIFDLGNNHVDLYSSNILRQRIFDVGITCFSCQVCAASFSTSGFLRAHNSMKTFNIQKNLDERLTNSNYFRIASTSGGGFQVIVHSFSQNVGVGWSQSQIFHAVSAPYWGGWIGHASAVSTIGDGSGVISSAVIGQDGTITFRVSTGNNGTNTQGTINSFIQVNAFNIDGITITAL